MSPHQFIDALRVLEDDGDPEPLVELFAADAECGTIATPRRFRGRDGAREFWTQDRALFGEVSSEFRAILHGPDGLALEWVRCGQSPSGGYVEYEGLSLLELADGEIRRFRAFYDPSRLGELVA